MECSRRNILHERLNVALITGTDLIIDAEDAGLLLLCLKIATHLSTLRNSNMSKTLVGYIEEFKR